MKILNTLLFCLLATSTFAQSKSDFEITETVTKKSLALKSIAAFKNASKHFFEDDSFTVRKESRGEFGGEVIFKH
jgi:hypothetical protein